MKLATIGHKPYFMNHYVEGSFNSTFRRSFDFNHYDWGFILDVIAFRPDITLIYRPEMLTQTILRTIPGIKIGFSTEPLPKYINNILIKTEETNIRESNYLRLQFSEYQALYHYDRLSMRYLNERGWDFTGFRHLPINTDWFNPHHNIEKKWDVFFIGKATARRNKIMDFLRMHPSINFLWVNHGIYGEELAFLFKQSKCVLNIHADDNINLEPRIYLAAACGIPVLSEPLGEHEFPLKENVFFTPMGHIDSSILLEAMHSSDRIHNHTMVEWNKISPLLSVSDFMIDVFNDLMEKRVGKCPALISKLTIKDYNKVTNIRESSSKTDFNFIISVREDTLTILKPKDIEEVDLIYIVPDIRWGTVKYRALFPSMALSKLGIKSCIVDQNTKYRKLLDLIGKTKYIIFHRCFGANAETILNQAIKRNLTIFSDIDDLELPGYEKYIPDYNLFSKEELDALENRIKYYPIFFENSKTSSINYSIERRYLLKTGFPFYWPPILTIILELMTNFKFCL
jgi:hypothetical protein